MIKLNCGNEHITEKPTNPHSTGRLCLVECFGFIDKMKIYETTKVCGMDSPSSGEFIRYISSINYWKQGLKYE